MMVTCEVEYSWVLIKWDGELFRKLHTSIIGSKPQLPFQASEEKELQESIHKLEVPGARQYALKRVAGQAMLSMQLKEALVEKGVYPHIADPIIEEFKSSGYLNDQDWIASFIRVQKLKKTGPQMIAQKLKAKGVPERLFSTLLDDDDPQERLRQLIATKYANRDLSDFKEKQKVVAALARKGYSFDDILNIL